MKKLVRKIFAGATVDLSSGIVGINNSIRDFRNEIDRLRLMNGKILTNQLKAMGRLKSLHDAEFQVFSQWGDDGIIQYLVNNIEIPHKTFIEFGVDNYMESNTRFLLLQDNWRGMVMDGSAKNVARIKKENFYWRHDLLALDVFVDAENINELLQRAGFPPELGILHVDIDGNDYWVWKAINVVNPVIVIVEYNSVFGIDKPWTVPYNPLFYRSKAHFSNLFYGSSLLSLCDLATEKGYSFIGCNSAGNNAYFIRNDKIGNFTVLTPDQGFVNSKFSESRSEDGQLTFLRGDQRLRSLKGLNVFNTRTGSLEQIL